ncbi:MAG TPA: GNAT family N-acetyltransferase [Mycobacteriales bacterium]|nr:GNAT family N-acetyltransferase [Mycobacteriales bacterium]
MTEDCVIAAAAFVGAWRWLATRLPAGTLAEHDGLLVATSGLADRTLNPAFAVSSSRDPAGAVRWSAAVRATLPAPTTGIDLPESRYPDLERALADLGYVERARRPGMLIESDSLTEAECDGPLVVRRVTSTADWVAYVELQAETFGMTPEVARGFPTYEAITGTADVTLLVGAHEGTVVSAASVFMTGTVAALYGVATAPASRGRGFGTAITAHAVRDAAGLGAAFVALQATSDGYSMYRRLGFRDVGDWVVHVDPAVE